MKNPDCPGDMDAILSSCVNPQEDPHKLAEKNTRELMR